MSDPLEAYVAVSVATLWTDPDRPRPVDAPALANPVDLPKWLADMTLADKFGLSEQNLSQTQALYGDPVHVLSEERGWCRIALPGQSTPKNPLGYPGWVPTAQLTDSLRFAAVATHRPFVRVCGAPTTWLYNDPLLSARTMQISFLTRLPVLDRVDTAVRVGTPDGARWISAAAVEAAGASGDGLEPTGADPVEVAKKFLGLPYLWGGRSGFAPDCSGLTSMAYAAAGVSIPRDASAQALHGGGKRVEAVDLQPGDLLFWAKDEGAGATHHVAMYTGEQHMIEAPGSAETVRITPVRFDAEYWGAVRFETGL